MKSKNEKNVLKVKIFWFPISREIFFEGEAISISSENKLGKFDILPQHTNFITLILNELILEKPNGEKISYKFKKGVLEVSENKVNIFLGF